jgi:acyl carrier protein
MDLLETGILDSMALVELLTSLEEKFGVSVNVLDLDLENFRSIQAIERFVVTSLEKAVKN